MAAIITPYQPTMNTPARILIVEDDAAIASVLVRGLNREGFSTEVAATLDEAFEQLSRQPADAYIVDMMLGDQSGNTFVRQARATGVTAPMIFLSALSDVDTRTEGLVAGADDYIVKPFEFSELLARLRVQLKRRRDTGTTLRFAGLEYDTALRRGRANDKEFGLTEKEGALLEMFLAQPDTPLNRERIFQRVWAGETTRSMNIVDVYVGYLRRKLRPIADTGIAVVTIRGKGFMLTKQ